MWTKKPEVILCPKCHQPGGVQLFTSISPCDKCLNPDEFHIPAYEDTEPFGIFTLSAPTLVLPTGSVALGPIMGVTNSTYGPTAVAISLLPGTIWPYGFGNKLTTRSLYPNHVPLVTCNQLPDYSWEVHVAGVCSVLSKITVGETLYAIP